MKNGIKKTLRNFKQRLFSLFASSSAHHSEPELWSERGSVTEPTDTAPEHVTNTDVSLRLLEAEFEKWPELSDVKQKIDACNGISLYLIGMLKDRSLEQVTLVTQYIAAKCPRLKKLTLCRDQLTHIPEAIRKLTKLQKLDLTYYNLTTLPEWIGELTKLQTLILPDNKLKTLPESLGELLYLRKLVICSNGLSELPKALGKLTDLQELDVSDNQLETLPESLGELTQLKKLNLRNNKLRELPKTIGNLTKLQKLEVFENKLTALPISIGALSQDTVVSVDQAHTSFPPEKITQKGFDNGIKPFMKSVYAIGDVKAISAALPQFAQLSKRCYWLTYGQPFGATDTQTASTESLLESLPRDIVVQGILAHVTGMPSNQIAAALTYIRSEPFQNLSRFDKLPAYLSNTSPYWQKQMQIEYEKNPPQEPLPRSREPMARPQESIESSRPSSRSFLSRLQNNHHSRSISNERESRDYSSSRFC